MEAPSGGAEIDDLKRVQKALAPVATSAREQRWDAERPWRTETHCWWEQDRLVVDLHDLGAGLARQAVVAVVDLAPKLSTGAVTFVTGRGRHSVGKAVLGKMVAEVLAGACQAHPGWRAAPGGLGRQVLITDPTRAPAGATGELGWGFWVGVAIFFGLAIWACLGRLQ